MSVVLFPVYNKFSVVRLFLNPPGLRGLKGREQGSRADFETEIGISIGCERVRKNLDELLRKIDAEAISANLQFLRSVVEQLKKDINSVPEGTEIPKALLTEAEELIAQAEQYLKFSELIENIGEVKSWLNICQEAREGVKSYESTALRSVVEQLKNNINSVPEGTEIPKALLTEAKGLIAQAEQYLKFSELIENIGEVKSWLNTLKEAGKSAINANLQFLRSVVEQLKKDINSIPEGTEIPEAFLTKTKEELSAGEQYLRSLGFERQIEVVKHWLNLYQRAGGELRDDHLQFLRGEVEQLKNDINSIPEGIEIPEALLTEAKGLIAQAERYFASLKR